MKTTFENLAAMLLLLVLFSKPAAAQESDKPAIPLPAEPPFGDVLAEYENAEIPPNHGLLIITPRVYLAGERIYIGMVVGEDSSPCARWHPRRECRTFVPFICTGTLPGGCDLTRP